MKRYLFLLFVGCSADKVDALPPAPVSWTSLDALPKPDASAEVLSKKERALPQALKVALEQSPIALTGLLDRDAPHASIAGLDDQSGVDAVVTMFKALYGPFHDRTITLGRVWHSPSKQSIEWYVSGTHSEPFMGVPPAHKLVTFRALTHVWTKDDGSIVDVHTYVDVAVILGQLGAGPRELVTLPAPTAPSAPVEIHEQDASGEEKSNVAVARAMIDALETSEDAYAGTLASDVEIITDEDQRRGVDDAKKQFRALRRALGQLDTTIQSAWGVGPFVLLEYFVDGEQLAPLAWIPLQPRGNVWRMQVSDVALVQDGKVRRVWRSSNPMQVIARGSSLFGARDAGSY